MSRFNHLNIPQEWEQYWSKYPEGYTMLEALIDWTGQVDEMVDFINGLETGTGGGSGGGDLSQYVKISDLGLYLPAPDVFTPINSVLQNYGYTDLHQFILTFEERGQTLSDLRSRIEALENI